MSKSRIIARCGLCALIFSIAIGAYAQAQIIVRLKNNTAATGLPKKYPITLVDVTANAPFALYNVLPGTDPEALEDLLKLDSNVVWAEDECKVELPDTTNGKGSGVPILGGSGLGTQFDFNSMYNANVNLLQQIRWTARSWAKTDRRVRVAILDTGLSPYQPAIWARVDASISMVPGDTNPYDLPVIAPSTDLTANRAVGHGTMVAGLISEVAPYAGLVIVRVADHRGQATAWRVIKGLAFAANNGAELVNISLGSLEELFAMSDVLDWTDEKGIQIVAPIGNDNLAKARFPAGYSKAICVSGVDDGDRKAVFSNWNSTADQSAPATGIVSAWWDGKMAMWAGTSFAAPLVTGAIADALRSRSFLGAKSLRSRITKIGDNIDGLNSNYTGKLGPRLNCAKLRTAILK